MPLIMFCLFKPTHRLLKRAVEHIYVTSLVYSHIIVHIELLGLVYVHTCKYSLRMVRILLAL